MLVVKYIDDPFPYKAYCSWRSSQGANKWAPRKHYIIRLASYLTIRKIKSTPGGKGHGCNKNGAEDYIKQNTKLFSKLEGCYRSPVTGFSVYF